LKNIFYVQTQEIAYVKLGRTAKQVVLGLRGANKMVRAQNIIEI
jgi:hypothetical protein